jgi:hypothetical protein
MKLKLLFLLIIFSSLSVQGQTKKTQKEADKQTWDWKYEIEAQGIGTQGTKQIKVWCYSKDVLTAIAQAKKNAVHGLIFRGYAGKSGIPTEKPMTTNPNLEQEKMDFFKPFFANGGKYLKYVVDISETPAVGDVIKIGKEYKVGIVVSVNVSELRKDLEAAGIIKSLNSGF